ncbi:MAG: DNA polymerase III subunit beta [Gemmatimonadetes bacterium]|jgi:DNA polymerase III subunit beta|nr:DNA polymerase III subunit beta [Gemmatimonadota bacterium]MBT6145945.1 DNA polymerase III subunit beta [Gemmatimonadota bacterium]MBT7864558.1 DNA polymerase III subunit beta [Gemmatimonadota bacterium]
MKLTVDRNELWRGLNTVLDAVASKPAQPVLANVLLEAAESQLTLSATDLDLSIRTRVTAAVDVPGRVTVPAKTLAEITREWPEADLQISLDDGRLILSGHLGAANSGEGRYSLAATPPDEFPDMPETLEGVELSFGDGGPIDGDLVRAMLDRTSFAVSRDETRPVLNGVLWRITPDFMSMVATDGSRMAEFRRHLDGTDRGTAEVILPPQACQQLGKLLDSAQDGLARAMVGDSQVLFEIGQTQLLTRLIEGPYVDYEQVVPRENDKRLTIAIDQLLPAVRRVSILSSSYTHQVRMSLQDGNVELTASSQEIGGEAREVIPGDYSSEALEVAYNAQYLMEILRKMGSDEVILDLKDSVTAAVVRPGEQLEGEELFYLLMPMRPSA